MTATERLINEIMAGARIPFARRHCEVLRELRVQVEDFVNSGRQSGRGEADMKHLLVERSGDRRQFARHEHATLDLGALLISAVLVSLVISAAQIVMQAAIAFGFGAPMLRVFGSRQTAIEALDILATAAASVGLMGLGRFSDPPWGICRHCRGTARHLRRGRLPPQFVLLPTPRCCEAFKSRFAAVLACFAVMGTAIFHPLRLRPWRPRGAG